MSKKQTKPKAAPRLRLLSYVLRYAHDKKRDYQKSVILAAFGVIWGMVPYFIIGWMVRDLMTGRRDFNHYLSLALVMALFWILRVVFHTWSTKCSHRATFQVLANVRKTICDKLARVPLGTVLDLPSGELKNTLVERVDAMETTLAHIVPEFTANLLAPLILFIYLLVIDWRLALFSLITLVLGLASYAGMMKDYEVKFGNYIQKTKVLNDTAVEYINGIEVIKAFGRSDSSYGKFVTAAREAADSCIDWMRSTIWYMAAALSVAPETLLFVLPVGGLFVLQGSLAPVRYVQIIILAFGLVTPLITAMSYSDDIGKAGVIFSEVDHLMQLPELVRPQQSQAVPKDNSMELETVRFAYKEQEVLHGISLSIPQGSFTALVGPSGSGKTTIARLLASLWEPDQGWILLGGVDLRSLSAADANQAIAYVNQDNYLFNLSVRENIRLGRPSASDQEVEAIARQSGCYDFISQLEHGFDTVVGDGGSHLSGGERQRLAIARAMLKNAPVLILDEATAYTDPENEALIQQSVAKLAQGKTLIVIAHRLSTVCDADQIAVISEGRLDDLGTHQELLAHQGLYSRLWAAHIEARDSEGGRIDA
ncbi:MAG: ABC transporter ATP-binding protein [Oscillospiraceae bacterium]|nr:ABC transporter ATP-binding protein [Oscillospiraceae bacterium]